LTETLRLILRQRPARITLGAGAGLAVLGLLVWQMTRATPFRIDDAYITFSFSKNLATGHGPNFSHGVRVEGYSNFLWMVLNALPLAIYRDVDIYTASRCLTAPFFALMLVATYALARSRVSALWAWAAVLLLTVHSDMITAFFSGLETLPYAALLTATFACQVAPRGHRRRRLALPFMTAAALMRIDGFLPLGFLLAWELLESRLDRRRLRGYLRWALPAVAIWVIWFSWRWWYYGLPLPSTYYAKALIPVLEPHRGLDYATDELMATGVLVMVPFLILLAHRMARPVWLLLLYAAVHTAYVIRVGGDWMPFGRFFMPIVPLGCVLCVWSVADLSARARALRRFPRMLQGAAVLAGLAALGRVAVYTNNAWVDTGEERNRMGNTAEQTQHVEDLRRAVRLLALVPRPGERLVTDYAGVVGYYTDAYVIDMWGLCNATIATRGNTDGVRPMYGRTCHACYPELRPQYFHTEVPLLRSPDAFSKHVDVVNAVWQTSGIGRYMDIVGGFRSGRVIDHRDNSALFFLEQRLSPEPPPRQLPAWATIDYPFGT